MATAMAVLLPTIGVDSVAFIGLALPMLGARARQDAPPGGTFDGNWNPGWKLGLVPSVSRRQKLVAIRIFVSG
jgi:hypothetical protein